MFIIHTTHIRSPTEYNISTVLTLYSKLLFPYFYEKINKINISTLYVALIKFWLGKNSNKKEKKNKFSAKFWYFIVRDICTQTGLKKIPYCILQ